MRSLSSALVVIAGVYGLLNAHRLVAGPDPFGSITYVISGTLLLVGVGGWIYCLKNED
jgi:formate hydrogenlyase subunit 3/multisubunit Na+/H+ antiporter MnhD subunit